MDLITVGLQASISLLHQGRGSTVRGGDERVLLLDHGGTTLGGSAEAVPGDSIMTVGEVNTRGHKLAELHEQDTRTYMPLLEDAQE
ncbi:hypothetical protein Tco_0018359 [Tanacetum coccineum]